MKFYLNETLTESVEIHTLDELKAFALGGTGKIEINFLEEHPLSGLRYPAIKKIRKKVYIRPIGDGNSIVYCKDKNGYEIQLDTPNFEEYSEAIEWCEENGYDWEEE